MELEEKRILKPPGARDILKIGLRNINVMKAIKVYTDAVNIKARARSQLEG